MVEGEDFGEGIRVRDGGVGRVGCERPGAGARGEEVQEGVGGFGRVSCGQGDWGVGGVDGERGREREGFDVGVGGWPCLYVSVRQLEMRDG